MKSKQEVKKLSQTEPTKTGQAHLFGNENSAYELTKPLQDSKDTITTILSGERLQRYRMLVSKIQHSY